MPVVCDKLVYLELQKTACTTIGAILVELFDGEQVPPKHGPLPDPATTKCVIGSVRNPWDYYVSLWAFGCQGRGDFHRLLTQRYLAPAIRKLPSPGPLVSEIMRPVSSWRRLYAEPHTEVRFRRWLSRVHSPVHGREFDPVYGASPLRHLAGYLTYRYCRLFSGDVGSVLESRDAARLAETVEASYLPRAMIRTEHLADDLVEATRVAGYEVDGALEEKIREKARSRTNVSDHKKYTEYYDDDSRDLVARRDRLIIARHGYCFGE